MPIDALLMGTLRFAHPTLVALVGCGERSEHTASADDSVRSSPTSYDNSAGGVAVALPENAERSHVGWAKERSDVPIDALLMGPLRFAHPRCTRWVW